MKKKVMLFAISALIAGSVTSSQAADNVGPGCGLGTMIFKGQKGLSTHTTAASTNGTVSNQLFGLTSGTLGCDATTVVSNEFEQKLFVASNMDSLSRDMAQGAGVYLQTLAETYSIAPEHQEHFFKLTQDNFATILDSSEHGAKELIATLNSSMMADPILVQYVN